MTSEEILERASQRLGIHNPNDMQKATAGLTVPLRLLLLAPTGSGKTLAFAIPFLKALNPAYEGIKGIVLAPTRELVLQIFECIRALAHPEYKTVAFYGGHDMRTEVNALEGRPDIVIATPGRLLDHLRRHHLDIYQVSTLAIDEYDKALELGFRDEMGAICSGMKKLKTLILTSATKAVEIPEFLDTEKLKTLDFLDGETAQAPELDIFKVKSADTDKLETLVALLKDLGPDRSIVFLNHREAAERVYSRLVSQGFSAGLYHGGLEQADREKALILFDNRTNNILVSTDLGSRGLDIENVADIIHYHLPPTTENWTHRNGRTARSGAKGNVYVIESDVDKVPDFVHTDEDYIPAGTSVPFKSGTGTLYFNAGKKEKISKGDVVGFLIKKGALPANEIGRIDVKDHGTFVAVPKTKMKSLIDTLSAFKLKNVRVRISPVKK